MGELFEKKISDAISEVDEKLKRCDDMDGEEQRVEVGEEEVEESDALYRGGEWAS